MTDKINTTPEAVGQAVGELTDLTRCRCHDASRQITTETALLPNTACAVPTRAVRSIKHSPRSRAALIVMALLM